MGISNSHERELAGSVGPSSSDTPSSEKGPGEGELLQQVRKGQLTTQERFGIIISPIGRP